MSHAEDMEISPWDYRLAEDIETVDVYKRQVVDVAAVGQLLVLKVLGTAVGGAAEHEQALALLFGVGQIGADGVQTLSLIHI